MNTTVRMKASQIYKDWHVIDAAGRPLGRVATEAATLLRGKHKPTYEPHLDDGDFVIVINAAQVQSSGNKAAQRKYYTHSGYPGGLKTRSYEEQLARFPERILEQAIWGMLPGGPLGRAMFKHLKVYKGSNHPHQSQITGSQRAAEARAAAPIAAPLKPARLRPLSVPQAAPEPAAKVVAAPKPKQAAPAVKPAARKTRAPKQAAVETAAAELAGQDEVVLASETPPSSDAVTAVEPTATVETTAVETAAAAEAPEKKPRTRRTKAASETKAAAPKAESKAKAAPEKKPARRRAAKTEE